MVSNSTSFSDITGKCVLSTDTSCNINFSKKSYSSLSCSDTSSKSFLSTVSQIKTSCLCKHIDESYSSNYSKVFSKPIAKDIMYSSFKTEDLIPFDDGILSDGPVDGSCIYKSKCDVAKYRDKAPHLSSGKKIDLIKCVLLPEKTFAFQKQQDLLNMSGLLLFPWLCYSLSEDASYCLSCVLFGHDFPIKASRVKICFHSPSRIGQVSYFRAHCEGKKKKN